MSIQLVLTAMGDFSEVKVQQAIAEARNEKIAEVTIENEKRTKKAFEASMGAMRASYMIISGISDVLGGSMGQIFTSIYGIATAGISTYKAIAAAMVFVPGAQLQAGLMFASLVSALISLGGVMTGQTELAGHISGLNMTLNGISQIMGGFNFL